MRYLLILFASVSIWLYATTDSKAAQLAIVDTDTSLYQGPKLDANVIRKLKKGTALDVSNFPTEGFFKARTRDKKEIGWVKADTLDLKSMAADTPPQ